VRLLDHRRITAILLIVVVYVCLAARTSGHDLERTEVTLRFASDATFVLDIANDPDWLLLRLEPFAAENGIPGRPAAASARPLSLAERDGLLASFAPIVIDRVVLWVDGHEVRPSTAEFIAPRARTQADDVLDQPKSEGEGASLGIYRLRGHMPVEARSLRWFYGIVIDPYPLTIRRADGRELKETILGRAWSDTLDLAGQFDRPPQREIITRYLVLGLRYVGSTGLGQILFVLGMLLMTLRLRPVVVQVATFAVAQTLSFGLTMAGVMTPASRVVWPVVALSVAYVVVESLLTKELTRWRLAFIFVFGLFHGAQLTSALSGIGAPPQFLTASGAFAAAVIGAEGAAMLATLLALGALRNPRTAGPNPLASSL
jgi:HupE / UreJ protein